MKPADAIRTARHRLRLSRHDMAIAIGTSEADLTAYEDGADVPPAILAAVRALEPSRSAESGMGRERWVRAVFHLAKYGRGELNVRQLHPDELADMLDLATHGPHLRTATTDPASYGVLREAALKLYVDGVLVVGGLPDWWTARVTTLTEHHFR
jgi:DNA-binding XRE family transcriptional regulator